MSEPMKKIIKTLDGELIVKLSQMKHPKSGAAVEYLSFSNGMDVAGVFVGPETKDGLVNVFSDAVDSVDDEDVAEAFEEEDEDYE